MSAITYLQYDCCEFFQITIVPITITFHRGHRLSIDFNDISQHRSRVFVSMINHGEENIAGDIGLQDERRKNKT